MKAIYEVQAFNDASESENPVHSDDFARQLGFEGALVSGEVVFGHMVYLPMRQHGAAWLTENTIEVRLIKPAYHGDLLTIELDGDDECCDVRCINAERTLLATITDHAGCTPPATGAISPLLSEVPRRQISWDSLQIDEPGPAHFWHADMETNLSLVDQLEDDLPIYRGKDALVHPLWIMRHCNAAFSRSFVLPAWIHTGSKLLCRGPLKVGEDIETRMVPVAKWAHKGHQFTRLEVSFLVDGEIRLHVEHTAIFNVAPKDH